MFERNSGITFVENDSAMILTLVTQWLAYLEALDPNRIELGLDRVVRVARALQVDTFNCPVITIAGTNGKGSCVECLMRVYQAAGYRAGTYTSPHLQYFHERIRINGIEISDEALVIAFNRVREAQFELSNPPFLSYFEFTTLSALVYFQQQQLDVIILEVGLGGRLDAVNAIDP